MSDAALWHRLYTHAPDRAGWGTTGGRLVDLERDAARLLPPEAAADLDDLLRKCVPSNGTTGWVARRYTAANGDAFAAVIVSYGDVVADAAGRRALINHARVVQVPRDEPLLDAAALVELGEAFPIDAVAHAPAEERLAAYLARVANETTVALRPVSMLALAELPRTFLIDLIASCLATHGKKQRVRYLLPRPEEGSLARTVAAGWTALPLALQRGSSWGVDIEDGCPVDAVLSTASGQRPSNAARREVVEMVTRYVNCLLDGPPEFRAILRDPEVSSIGRLEAAVQEGGRVQMTKGRGNDVRPPAGSSSEPDLAAELDRQYRAMEQSLKAYIDQRIAAISTSDSRARGAALPSVEETVHEQPLPKSSPSMKTPAAPRRVPPKVLLIASVLAVLVISAGVWMFFKKPKFTTSRTTRPAPAATRETPRERPSEPPPRNEGGGERRIIGAAIATGQGDGQWAVSLKNLMEKNGPLVGARMRDAADGIDLDGEAVTTDVRDELNELATRVEQGRELTQAQRARVRAFLLEYAAALDAREAGIRVDANLRDIKPEVISKLKSTYSVTLRSASPSDPDLQSEIILRWMETRAQ